MPQGKLEPATWEHALRFAAGKLKEIRDSKGGAAIGVIGSNRTTNEENYLLQKFARTVLQHQQHRPRAHHGLRGLCPRPRRTHGKTASLRDIATAPAILLVGGNPTEEHPLLAWNLRTNVRLNRARLYIANSKPIKLERQAKATQELPADGYKQPRRFPRCRPMPTSARPSLAEESLLVVFGQEFRGQAVESSGRLGPEARQSCRFAYLGDHANSRGAADMGLFPDLLPGYVPVTAPGAFAEYPGLPAAPGKTLPEMLRRGAAKANWAHCLSSARIRWPRLACRSRGPEEDIRHRAGPFSH